MQGCKEDEIYEKAVQKQELGGNTADSEVEIKQKLINVLPIKKYKERNKYWENCSI